MAETEPKLEQLRDEDGMRQEALREAEAALNDWQQRWDAHSRSHAEAPRSAQVDRTRNELMRTCGTDVFRNALTVAHVSERQPRADEHRQRTA